MIAGLRRELFVEDLKLSECMLFRSTRPVARDDFYEIGSGRLVVGTYPKIVLIRGMIVSRKVASLT